MNLIQQIRDKTCPIRLLTRERENRHVFPKQKDDASDRNDVTTPVRIGRTSGGNGDISENVGTVMEFMDADRIYNGRFLENVGIDEFNVHWLGREYYTENIENVDADRSIHYKFKNGKSLSSRRHQGYDIKPLDSLESCVAAQLCKEHEKIDEYMYSSFHSPSIPVLRPLLVTDGSRIISRATTNLSGPSSNGREDKPRESCLEKNNQPGPPDGMILFFLGIAIGLFSVAMANKREVDRLSKDLKQRQNLVQDLREELEMKDALTVRELADEASQSQRVDDDLSQFNLEHSSLSSERIGKLSRYDGEKQNNSMVKNSELRNKIEAELEAELERLELNLKTSNLNRARDYIELDQDLEVSVVEGDTKVNVPTWRTDGASESDDETSTIANNYCEPSSYYAVPPSELSLRLHEVIEARLEKRIKELETALQSSESRLHSLESQQRFTYNDIEFSSTPRSPIYMYQDSDKEEPLFINLSGNALDAYNEAYAEMLSTTDSDKERTAQQMPPSVLNNYNIEERRPRSLLHLQRRTSEEQTSRSLRSSEKGESDGEDSDELDMLLIKRIVERRRSGSNILVYGT